MHHRILSLSLATAALLSVDAVARPASADAQCAGLISTLQSAGSCMYDGFTFSDVLVSRTVTTGPNAVSVATDFEFNVFSWLVSSGDRFVGLRLRPYMQVSSVDATDYCVERVLGFCTRSVTGSWSGS